MARFEPKVEKKLREAGWFPGRIATDRNWPMPERLTARVQSVLDEFGGLHIGKTGPGGKWAAHDVTVDPIRAGPSLELAMEDDPQLARQLYPVASFEGELSFLLLNPDGRVFYTCEIASGLELVADGFDTALSMVLTGKTWRTE